MLSLQHLSALSVLRLDHKHVENEAELCQIVASVLTLPLPSEIDARNKNSLNNLYCSEMMLRSIGLLDKIRIYNDCLRFDLLDKLIVSMTPSEAVALTIDFYEDGSDSLAEYIEEKAKIDYNLLYADHTLLYRIAQKEVFLKLVAKGLDIGKRFHELICFDYDFCRRYYYPYNQWIIDAVSQDALAGQNLMFCYDERNIAVVRDQTVEIVSLVAA